MPKHLTQQLFSAFAQGYFPMITKEYGLTWEQPPTRAIIILKDLKFSKSLLRGTEVFSFKRNTQFAEVMQECAAPGIKRPETWLTPELQQAYQELYELGLAHCTESWRNNRLVGGTFAVQIHNYVTAESMFSKETNASKACLVEMLKNCQAQGIEFVDVQYLTEHLERFGAIEVSHSEFKKMHQRALNP